jgi:hypothetical protein
MPSHWAPVVEQLLAVEVHNCSSAGPGPEVWPPEVWPPEVWPPEVCPSLLCRIKHMLTYNIPGLILKVTCHFAGAGFGGSTLCPSI